MKSDYRNTLHSFIFPCKETASAATDDSERVYVIAREKHHEGKLYIWSPAVVILVINLLLSTTFIDTSIILLLISTL